MKSTTSLHEIKTTEKFYKANGQFEKSYGIRSTIEKLEQGLRVYVVTQESAGVVGSFFNEKDAFNMMNSIAEKLNNHKCYLDSDYDRVIVYRYSIASICRADSDYDRVIVYKDKNDSIKDRISITSSVVK